MIVMLKHVRLFYSHNLFEASVAKGAEANAKPKFSFEGAVEPGSDNHKLMKSAVVSAAQAEWGDKWEAFLKEANGKGLVWCLRDGDSKLDKDGNTKPEYAGKIIISAKNEVRPTVFAGGPEGRNPTTKEDGLIYSGCYVNVKIDVKAGSKPKRQVYAYLLGVQKAADGDPIGHSMASAEDFDPVKPENTGAKAASSDGSDIFGGGNVKDVL